MSVTLRFEQSESLHERWSDQTDTREVSDLDYVQVTYNTIEGWKNGNVVVAAFFTDNGVWETENGEHWSDIILNTDFG